MMASARILLAVTGSIAAYKACEICSSLAKKNYKVKTILTKGALEFIKPLSFSALSSDKVYTNENKISEDNLITHIELSQWADVLVIAPASANCLFKLAHGAADELLYETYLASDLKNLPVLIAPAMNTNMWQHASVQENIKLLQARGAQLIEPASGVLACKAVGQGKLADTDEIVAHIERTLAVLRKVKPLKLLTKSDHASFTNNSSDLDKLAGLIAKADSLSEMTKIDNLIVESDIDDVENIVPMPYFDSKQFLDSAAEQGQIKPNHDHHHEVRSSSLSGLNLIITAGGTKEYLDPVRYLGNASSGQMGLALAKAACKAGAQQITLITTVKSHYEDLLRYADLGINVNEDINNILANKTSNTTNQNQNKDKNATHQASKNSTVNANRGEVCIDGAKASVNHDELMVNSTRTGVNHGEFNADSTKASINHSKFYIENTCIQIIQVESCAELQTAIKAELGAHDILIMAAAVADYRPAAPEQHKIKKNEDQLTLNLVKNPDILKSLIPFKKSEQYFVGFALESENLRENALKKLTEKNLDLIIANDASALNASSSQLELFYARNNEILNKSLRKQDKIINAQAIIEFISSNYEKNPNRTNWQT